MKICEICGSEFIVRQKNTHTRKYCYTCSPEGKSGATTEQSKVIRRAKKAELVRRKGGKCLICGFDKSVAAMDFHHLDPTKKDHDAGFGKNIAWHRLLAETEKCILLCSNCHRMLHGDEVVLPISSSGEDVSLRN